MKNGEDLLSVLDMFFHLGAVDGDIIKVDDYTSAYECSKNMIHDPHEHARGI
jgi:hypothetical protein